jgi:hypothetical protein
MRYKLYTARNQEDLHMGLIQVALEDEEENTMVATIDTKLDAVKRMDWGELSTMVETLRRAHRRNSWPAEGGGLAIIRYYTSPDLSALSGDRKLDAVRSGIIEMVLNGWSPSCIVVEGILFRSVDGAWVEAGPDDWCAGGEDAVCGDCFEFEGEDL